MNRLLVTGANGQLGLALQEAAKDSNLEIVFMDKNSLDITNTKAIKEVFASQSFDVCINAAAYTHVDGAEANKELAYTINATAVETLAKACKQHDCWLIHISTDYVFDGKLDRPYTTSDNPNPLNVYGASKLASDKIFVAANNLSGKDACRFSVVRYGNVVGSRGSVIPFFRKLIEQGVDELPITDERMTRFWITLEQGTVFVTSCFGLMKGGEIFVPKIPSMKIIDLARCMAPSLKHRVIGIRPGEKLHEAMTTIDDARNLIEFKDRFILLPALKFWNKTDADDYQGKPVEKNFVYSSDTNQNCLTEAEFKLNF